MILLHEFRPDHAAYPGQSVIISDGEKHETNWNGILFIPSGVVVSMHSDGTVETKSGPGVVETTTGQIIEEKSIRVQDARETTAMQKLKRSKQFAVQNEKYAAFIDRQIIWQQKSENESDQFLEILDIETQYLKSKSAQMPIRDRLLEIDTLRKNLEKISGNAMHPADLRITIMKTAYDLGLKNLEAERRDTRNPETIKLLQYKLSRLFIEINELKKQKRNEFGCPFSDDEIVNNPMGESFLMKNGKLTGIKQKLDGTTYPSHMFFGCDFGEVQRENESDHNVPVKMLDNFLEPVSETKFFSVIIDEKSLTTEPHALTFKNGEFVFVPYRIDPDLLFFIETGSIQHGTSGMFLEMIDRKIVGRREKPEYELNIEKSPRKMMYLYEISKFGLILARNGNKMGIQFGAPSSNFIVFPVARKKIS
jgi:hypothetical protein